MFDDRDIEVAESGHRQRARDRGPRAGRKATGSRFARLSVTGTKTHPTVYGWTQANALS